MVIFKQRSRVLESRDIYTYPKKDYVLSVATESGFQLEFFTTSNLRYEKTKWIVGGIYVLKSAQLADTGA